MGNTFTTPFTEDAKISKEHPYWTRAEIALFRDHFSSIDELTLKFENSVISSFNTYLNKCFEENLGESIDNCDDVSMYLGKIMRSTTDFLTQFVWKPVLMHHKENMKGAAELPATLLFLSILFDLTDFIVA